ncbi:MAG: Ig-like domain-containing protein, partial [Paramuribaculum sp.]|nr:Ig-like domain-containing protein [Paramuribaculum sp.]
MYVSKTNLLFTSLLILLLSGCSGSGSDSEPEPATVSVSSISLTPTSLSLAVGESADITATVKPDNATDKRVSWTSSNPKVATVANGKVTAVAEGSTTITAYAGSAKAECRVTVTAAQITSITLDQSALELFPGETETLKATIAPASASSDHLTWESSDPTVATVDDSGTVSALAPGTTKITVKASGVQAECTVTVKTVAVTAVSINKTSLDLLPGDTETLVATVTPDNATDKSV